MSKQKAEEFIEETRPSRIVVVEDTKFIFKTNFEGNPDNDTKYHSKTRKGNILIPADLAKELADDGYNVKVTRPKEGEEEGFIPKYFVSITLNYDSELAQDRPPKVYLVSGNAKPRLLDRDTVKIIDNIYVTNVNVTLEKTYLKSYDRKVLYIRTMYVQQDVDDDPWAARFGTMEDTGREQPEGPTDEEDVLPFD